MSLNGDFLPYLLLALAAALLIHALVVRMHGKSTTGASNATGSGLGGASASKEAEEERDPPRAFTPAQLRKYNGVVPPEGAPKWDLDAGKIYVALKGQVYDVTSAPGFYGPGGGYHVFAGRDASRALATLSFDEAALENPAIDDLSAMEADQLDEWIFKFQTKGYPVVGRLVTPPPCRAMTVEELAAFDGTGPVPEGRIDPLCYVACKGKVFDVSFGGWDMYGPGASYHRFAGKDVSRALAKMSFEPSDIASRDLSDLTPAQLKVLDDWLERFETRKLYPVVGTLPPPPPPSS